MIKILGILIAGLLFNLNPAFAEIKNSFYSNPINFQIETTKQEFKVGEVFGGQIKIHNGYANGIPNTFIIKLFHEDQLINSYTTSIQHIPMGEMTLAFKACGIPDLTYDVNNVGNWKMIVFQTNTEESEAASVSFRIIPRS